MSRRILILGPHGSGKSTLVRQVMSLYERRRPIPGGVGTLPLGYELHHVSRVPVGEGHYDEHLYGRLVVLGNYEETQRDQYGMHQFERYCSNFISAIEYATSAECCVLMEGGFTKPRRLESEEGKRFCSGLLVICLTPANAPRCMRSSLTTEQYFKHGRAVLTLSDKLERSGVEVFRTAHRESALKVVCSVIDPDLNYGGVKRFEKDYR